MHDRDEHFEDLPVAIRGRLVARDRALSVVTPQIDREIESAAKNHFAVRGDTALPRAKRVARWMLPAAVAAAAVLFVVLIVPIDRHAPSIAALESDIDGSGRIDVLDAYALSRRRANDAALASQQDIDALMARIVSLAQTESAL